MKNFIIIAGLLILIVIGYFAFVDTDGDSEVRDGEANLITETDGAGETVRGTVADVDLEQMAVDGPAVITIETALGEMVAIEVPSMGLQLCNAADRILDVSQLSIGDEVEVRGQVDADGTIVPCEGSDHFFEMADDASADAGAVAKVDERDTTREAGEQVAVNTAALPHTGYPDPAEDGDIAAHHQVIAEAVRVHIAAHMDLPKAQVGIATVERVNWINGCLELPKPGEVCTEAIVPGYRVTAVAEGVAVNARTDGDASVIRVK